MNKIVIGLILVLVLSFCVGLTGCTIAEGSDTGTFSTEKTKTTIGLDGIKEEKKSCPFWDRDC